MTEDKPQTRNLLIRAGVVVAGVVLLAVALPVIYFAWLSALGLIGIGLTAVIGIAAVRALPYLGQKWENKLLSMRMGEARANPIEQIQNNVLRKASQLNAFKGGLTQIGGQISTLESTLKEQKKRDPEEDFAEQDAALAKMKQFYRAKQGSYATAYAALEDYKKAVERAKFKYNFGTSAQGIAQAMNSQDAKTLVENMLADEAFKAVDQRYNTAFAALDMDSAEINNAKQLTFGKGVTLDVAPIRIPVMQDKK